MMKISTKRRGTQREIAADKAAKQQQEQEMQQKLAMFDQLQARIQELESQHSNVTAAAHLMQNMIDSRVIE